MTSTNLFQRKNTERCYFCSQFTLVLMKNFRQKKGSFPSLFPKLTNQFINIAWTTKLTALVAQLLQVLQQQRRSPLQQRRLPLWQRRLPLR